MTCGRLVQMSAQKFSSTDVPALLAAAGMEYHFLANRQCNLEKRYE